MGEKKKSGKRDSSSMHGAGLCAILKRIVRESLSEKISWSKDEGDEGAKHEDIRKEHSGRGNGPKVEQPTERPGASGQKQ